MNLLDRLAYDTGGYTVQEILSSFCKKIIEIIDLVNKNEEVCDETHTIIENIRNEVVPDLVDDIMKEMQDYGYFDNLVNVTLIGQLRTELTKLLNDTITDYTTRLDTKMNKSDIITMGNLGQDVKEAMTGGSVAVIGNNMVNIGQMTYNIQEDIGRWCNEEFTLNEYGFNTTTGLKDTDLDNRINSWELDVSSGERLRISGFTFGGADCCIMFLNSSGAIISKIDDEEWGTPIEYEFTCPQETTKVKMNVWDNNSTKTIKRLKYAGIVNKNDFKIASKLELKDITFLANVREQLKDYDNIDYTESSFAYAIKDNKPYLYETGGAGNSHTILSVKFGEIYKIDMTTISTTSAYAVILTDDDDNVLFSVKPSATIEKETFEVEIIESATKMYVSFRKQLCTIGREKVGSVNKSKNEIPTFYKEHIKKKIDRIQELEMQYGGNGTTFAIITDIHWENNNKYSPVLIKEIMENTNCEFVINNGDSLFASTNDINDRKQGIRVANEVRKAFTLATNNNFYSVRGNHDNNSTGGEDEEEKLLNQNEMYSFLVARNEKRIVGDENNLSALYYFFDDNKNRIRHIILDSFEDGQAEGVISVTQMKWLCEKALKFEGNWNICVYTHKPVSPFETSEFKEVRQILNSIRYSSQYSTTYTDNNGLTYNINVDFSDSKHYIMYVANGHSHIDVMTQDNNITYFKSVCDAKYSNAVEIDNRKEVNCQSFDVVCINKTNKTINLVRIGCGSDERIFTYGDNASIIKNKNLNTK